MNIRPFGAAGGPPGTMASAGSQPLPIVGVPGIPGGTLVNPMPVIGTGARGPAPFMSGVTSRVSRKTVLALTASNGRGTGPAASRAPEAFVYAGARTAGVRSNHGLLGAIVAADIRNPYVARHLLRAGMVAGATRVR